MIAALTYHQTAIRSLVLVLVLLVELMAVSLGFDAYQPALFNNGQWFEFISYAGQLAKMLVAVLVFSALGLWPRLPDHWKTLNQAVAEYPYRYIITTQFISFALFFWCTSTLFGQGVGTDEISDSLVIAWLVTLVATAGLWLLSLAPWRFWIKLISIESKVFIAAVAVGILAWILASFAQVLWTPLSDLTFQLSAAMLNLVYPEIIVDPDLKRLGAQNFVVSIAPACSGYEGMGLMVIFTGFYLAIFRHEFRFPQALLLFPIGIVTIWLFNNFRIALLISIGASFSPAVAIGGFHSQAGWISFIAVIILTLMLAYRMPFFSTLPTRLQTANRQLNLPMALLIPFIVLLAAMIFTSALAADFDWLYPVRVIAVALAIAGCWRFYRLTRLKVKLEPWLAGIIVFGLWVLLVPGDPVQSEVYSAQLSNASTTTMAVWLLFRFLGSVVTVPIAEELLFRGYLLARFARQGIVLEGRIAFSWVALILSSILFGLLHANWVAGIVAGLIFGLVRYRSDSIKDAVIAHASANLLLSVYVVSSGNWSLW